MDKDSVVIQKQYRDPFRLLDTAKMSYELGVIPLISIITGVFVGLTGKMRTGQIAVAALTPLQIFLLVAQNFALWAFARVLVYFLLVYFSANIVQRIRATGSARTDATTA